MTNSFIDDLADIPGLNDMTRKVKDRGLRVTGEDADGDYDATDDDLGTKSKRDRETFPCEMCNGTGMYQHPRRHQPKSECFACKGRGFYYKSRADREASRAKRAARKQRVRDEGKAEFNAQNPGLIDKLRELATWNDFAAKMLEGYNQWNSLTEKQVEAVKRMIEKQTLRDAEREAQRKARTENAPVVNTDALKEAFDKASAAGLKRPVLRYEGFTVSKAPDNGKNAGALYVKDGETYLGKIAGGKYLATREAQAMGLIDKVAATMQDPLALAIAYGKRTGHCSCCGRPLVDPVSVHNGIGPICASKYGFILNTNVPPNKAIVQGKKVDVAPRTSTKYEYAPGMTADEKRKMRAAARRAARS